MLWGFSIGGNKPNSFRYADNTTLIAVPEEESSTLIKRVEAVSENIGLFLNKH